MKTGRNQTCPCGSGKKFKHCHGKRGVDFRDLSFDKWVRELSVRGKNLLFLNEIANALQADTIEKPPKSFPEFVKNLKKAITPDAVKKIHLAIPEIWPDKEDLNRCLEEEKSKNSGLFIGSYLFDVTEFILNRHALYDNTIILIDPFHDHRRVVPEYNPVEKPEEHIITTFHYVLLWLQLMPWIDAGIIKIIRNPGDFNHNLWIETCEISRKRADQSDELKKALENQDRPVELEEFFSEQFSLMQPDEYWIDKMKDSVGDEERIRKFLRNKREQSLYYVDVARKKQFISWSSGANYEMGKYICEKTNSHIITDLSYRWKEIEYDRNINGVNINSWTPFSKAFQESELKHLNGLSFDDLLKLRNDGYLDDMRAFLRRTWRQCSSEDELDINNVENLSAELIHNINLAEAEWKKIDTNLIKWFGSESIIGTAIGVSAGVGHWLPVAAISAAAAVNLAVSTRERKSFVAQFPAAFFLESVRKNT